MPVLGALAAAALAGLAAGAAEVGKPHVVFILVDDWGWDNVGYHRQKGDKEIVTPNIDQLVKEGIELDRHYTYHYCSPSRSTLQSGRLSVHVNFGFDDPMRVNPKDPVKGMAGVPRNMTGIAEKLRAAGYRTHMTGKWDAGMAYWEQTPMGRGYESFFGYYHHAEDYYTQRLSDSAASADVCGNLVDLWNTTGPARGRNGSAYVEEMFTENTLGILDRHDPKEPLFLFHAFHLLHTPLQIPQDWEDKFSFLTNQYQRKYAAMTHYMDDVVGQIVSKLKAKNMWDKTLVVMSSDNGGPTYNLEPLASIGAGAASNLPLRGGKMTDWEGGVRVNALVSGGVLPAAKRGTKLQDYLHMADWYATLCAIAGVDVTDDRAAKAGLPPVDGIDQSGLIFGSAAPGSGKRTEIHHSARSLLSGRWKLITGGMQLLEMQLFEHATHGGPFILYNDYVTGYDAPPSPFRNPKFCGFGCLYDVINDPTEVTDVAKDHPEVVRQLKARLAELNKGLFLPDRGAPYKPGCDRWGGFYGPFMGGNATAADELGSAVFV